MIHLFCMDGGIGGARTRDLGLKRALLYRLSYNPKISFRAVSYKELDFCRIFFLE